MQIRWAPKAADALEAIFDYISRDNPTEARRVASARRFMIASAACSEPSHLAGGAAA